MISILRLKTARGCGQILTVLAVFWLVHTGPLGAQSTGTFIDRAAPTDLRVMSYNIWNDSIFSDTHATRPGKFARVVQALQPDVVALQEIYTHTAEQTAALFNSLLPLSGGASWQAYRGGDNVLVSRYPLSLERFNTSPASQRDLAIALVDLPDAVYPRDFYFMNNHFKCCGNPGGPEDAERQQQADALVSWMRDARTPGGGVDLAVNTPMAVLGDLNIVGSLDPLNNLIAGNIVDEAFYGGDSPPDWDGSPLADAHPVHNETGAADYTWRNDNSEFDPGRLDYVLFTDSALTMTKRFVLNTVAMSSAQRAAVGLQQLDTTINSSVYDHLPLVIDFRLPAPQPGDYNLDGSVDSLDLDAWRAAFGTTSAAADGNRDGRVDAADYIVWRQNVVSTASAAEGRAPVPEPASYLLFIAVCCAAASMRRRPQPLVP